MNKTGCECDNVHAVENLHKCQDDEYMGDQ